MAHETHYITKVLEVDNRLEIDIRSTNMFSDILREATKKNFNVTKLIMYA